MYERTNEGSEAVEENTSRKVKCTESLPVFSSSHSKSGMCINLIVRRLLLMSSVSVLAWSPD